MRAGELRGPARVRRTRAGAGGAAGGTREGAGDAGRGGRGGCDGAGRTRACGGPGRRRHGRLRGLAGDAAGSAGPGQNGRRGRLTSLTPPRRAERRVSGPRGPVSGALPARLWRLQGALASRRSPWGEPRARSGWGAARPRGRVWGSGPFSGNPPDPSRPRRSGPLEGESRVRGREVKAGR